jgi:microcompartment protein CcmK/EutM
LNRGRVIGEVWAARQAAGLEHQRLVVVALAGERRALVASDTLGTRAGQEVLVALGSGARNVLQPGPDNRHVLTDAAVALLIDGGTEGDS